MTGCRLHDADVPGEISDCGEQLDIPMEYEMPKWRHKKRGTTYEVVTDSASLQCSAAEDFERMFEDDTWTVYRNIQTGHMWVRPTQEFLDGRFERLEEDDA